MRSDDEVRSQLPAPPAPQGGYVPAVAHGGLVVTAGMTPRVDGELRYVGQVGGEVTLEEARAAAAVAATNALSAALDALPESGRLERLLRLTVYVSAVRGFTQHSAVADAASTRLRELLGERGAACRSAVGVASLPGGACVELELTAAWSEAGPSA